MVRVYCILEHENEFRKSANKKRKEIEMISRLIEEKIARKQKIKKNKYIEKKTSKLVN